MPAPYQDIRLDRMKVECDPATRAVFDSFNATDTVFPFPDLVTEMVYEQAVRTPQGLAVTEGDLRLTYGELQTRVEQTAAAVVAAGCFRGQIAALMATRGVGFVSTLLGILRAGAVYLPIDPRLPTARLRQILESSRPSVVIVDHAVFEARAGALREVGVPEGGPIRLEDLCSGRHPRAPDPDIGPEDLAYVLYTSGSTGKPKGAMVQHRGLSNHLCVKVTDLALEATDSVAQNSPQSSDVSIWQMLAPLLVGGAVHVLRDDIATDPMTLCAAVVDQGITVLELVPSMLRAVIEAKQGEPRARRPFGSLRTMVVSGEELFPSLARDWFDLEPGASLVNAYGSTECSDDVSHHAVRAAPSEDVIHLPVGTPVANTKLWVLRQTVSCSYRLCPPGEEGEICVTGAGVGLGYLNEPERTREAFFTDPFTAGRRLYRTGDLGLLREDGQLLYLGRIDRQVKLRGHRIELTEIESVLCSHDRVRAAAVDLRTTRVGRRSVARERLVADTVAESKVLVGYVVSRDALTAAELRVWLSERLDAPMVPERLVFLERLPLTPHGKVDLRALPEPGSDRPALSAPYAAPVGDLETAIADVCAEVAPPIAPRNSVEGVLSGIWAEVLGLETVGVNHGFFEMGGDSLGAVLLVVRMEKALGRKVPLIQVFQGHTIEEIARGFVEPAELDRAVIVPVRVSGSGPRFFCVSTRMSLTAPLAEQLGPGCRFYECLVSDVDESAQAATVEAIASRLVRAVVAIQPEGPYLFGGQCFGGVVAFEMARQVSERGGSVARLVLFDSHCPDPAGEPFPRMSPWVSRMKTHRKRVSLYGFRGWFATGLRNRWARVATWWGDRLASPQRRADLELYRRRRVGLTRTFRQAASGYTPSVFHGPIVHFISGDHPPVHDHDPRLRWRRWATGGMEVHHVPGNHTSMFEPPNVVSLGKHMKPYVGEGPDPPLSAVPRRAASE
jgi:amino acid adenylation domain-containing protein